MNTTTKKTIIAALNKAGRRDLALAFASQVIAAPKIRTSQQRLLSHVVHIQRLVVEAVAAIKAGGEQETIEAVLTLSYQTLESFAKMMYEINLGNASMLIKKMAHSLADSTAEEL
jgi:hypothetical protein